MIGPLVRGARLIHIFSIIVFSGLILSCSLKAVTPQSQDRMTASIQDIRVLQEAEKTRVEIEGEEPMIYTTFKLSNPDRLVVDIADVDLGEFSEDILIEEGPVRGIRPGSGAGKGISRLEFEFSEEAEADVRTDGMNLIVEVMHNAEPKKGFVFFEEETVDEDPDEVVSVSSHEENGPLVDPVAPSLLTADLMTTPDVVNPETALSESDPVNEEAVSDENIILSKPMDVSPEMPDFLAESEEIVSGLEPEEAPENQVALPPAKKVTGIHFEEGDDLKLLVKSDGTLAPKAFFIGKGEKKRLVIDLPGVKMSTFKSRVSVADSRVKRARIGQHEKKLRLVLDLHSPIAYTMVQNQGDLNVLIKHPAKPGETQAKTEMMETAAPEIPAGDLGEADDAMPKAVHTAMVSEETKPEEQDLDNDPVSDREDTHAEGQTNAQEKPFDLPLTSPGVAEAATLTSELPLPIPAPDTQETEESEGGQDSEIEDEVPPSLKSPLSEDNPSLESKEIPEETAPAESESIALSPLSDEKKVLDTEEVPEKPETAEMPAKKMEPPLVDAPMAPPEKEEEVLPVKEEVQVEDPEEAKKKILLRRKRREEAKVKREALAKAKAEEAEAVAVASEEQSKYTGRKISLDFQNAEITNVVRLIADVSGLNFVIGDDVKGEITVKMDNVPWDQALEIILDIRNLGMVREGDIIRITTLANLTKQRNEKAQAMETKIRSEEMLTRVLYVNYAKAEQMKTLLLKLLSSRGEIMVASRVNALVVKDIIANLDQVEEMAKKLDTKTPQVLIEARVVEVQPNFKRSLGVKWGADFKTNNGGNSIGLGNSAGDVGVFSQGPDFAVNLPAATPLGGIGFSFGRFTESPFQLDLRLSAGESQEMTRIVSTPKIMVLDNNEALIKQGSQIPFQSSSANGGTNVQLIDASLQLKVIPHISLDGGILLDLELTKNEPGPPVQGSDQPSIFEKEVTTQVLLMDGETMVIGGIYETKSTESESGIPLLKDIPGLGWLFKNKEKSESTTELLIFITPTVMK